MDNYSIVIFENISSSDFTGYWGQKPYLVKAGETMKMPYYLAKHIAKHLATRELGAELVESDTKKLNFIKSCIHDLSIPKTVSDETELLVEQANDEVEETEEEFEELNEKTNEDTSEKTVKKSRATKATGYKRG